ncbi:MAG: spondin domain-containing protein [Phycisphaerae bacterium]|nr:spondin domain-containing protein [Phycisphaerae bacterium]
MNKQERKIKPAFWAFAFALTAFLTAAVPLQAQTHEIMVTIENLAPPGGVYFTPVWLGFHNGSYDLFDPGGLAAAGLERLAEDGDATALRVEFAAAVGDTGGMDDVVTAPEGFAGAPVFDPGDTASAQYTVDSTMNRYASFVSMIIPSNDAFIGNHNPQHIELFDADGSFKGKQIITILGSMIWDVGTELNTEMDAAFINQTAPNAGVTTMCPVLPHPGFLGSYGNPGSDPIILGGTGPDDILFDLVAADFTLPYTVVARIIIEPVPAEGQ